MPKQTVFLSGIPVAVEYSYSFLTKLTEDYTTDEPAEISISLTEKDITFEQKRVEGQYSPGYLESLAFFRRACTVLAPHGTILFHSCVLVSGGKGYLFAAPSGTGKSTHAKLWLSLSHTDCDILNGDKPLIRFVDDVPTVFGTPYTGKERWGHPGSAPIGGICFLHRGIENRIQPILPSEALAEALRQTFRPYDAEAMGSVLKTLIKLLSSVPLYSLSCDISEEAARLSYSTMTGVQYLFVGE